MIAYGHLKITNHLEMMASLLNFIKHFRILLETHLLILLIAYTDAVKTSKNKQ